MIFLKTLVIVTFLVAIAGHIFTLAGLRIPPTINDENPYVSYFDSDAFVNTSGNDNVEVSYAPEH